MFSSAEHAEDHEAPWPMGLALITLTAMFVTNGGRSTWFVGALALMVCLTFAMTLYLLPPQGR